MAAKTLANEMINLLQTIAPMQTTTVQQVQVTTTVTTITNGVMTGAPLPGQAFENPTKMSGAYSHGNLMLPVQRSPEKPQTEFTNMGSSRM